MDMLIEGTGAMACLFAARLSRASVEVTISGTWREALNVLKTRGVRLVEDDGSEHTYPVQVTDRNDHRGHYGQTLVLVKSWQTERVAEQLQHCLKKDGSVLTLQNGLGNKEKLSAIMGDKRVCLGVTTTGATLLAPGIVCEGGIGKVSLGKHPRIEPIAEVLQQAGFDIEIVSDPQALLWGKLIINAAINPLTALMRVPNGELLRRCPAHDLMCEAALEAARVAQAKSITLPYADPVAAVEEVAQRTASNHSSMLQDVLRGAVTEIDAINGALVRAGEQTGIPTPVNLTLWRLVKGLEKPNGQTLPQ